MSLTRNALTFLLCAIVFAAECESNFVDRVTKYMVDDIGTRRITLIMDFSCKVSMKSNEIVQGIIKIVPCLVIDTKLLKSNESRDRNVVNTRRLISRRFEHRAMKVLIINNNGGREQVEESLIDYIELFTKFPAQAPRLKCIIIVFNRNNSIDFSNILKFSWNKQFLYITIIEIYDKFINAFRSSSRIEESSVRIHEYNPFKDAYTSTPFSEKTQLFTNKLLNLHGYGLKTGFVEEIPLVMSRGDKLNADDIYGMDTDFSKTLATVMNFSMIIKTNSSRHINALLHNNSIDFAVNIYSIVGYSNRHRENRQTTKSIFMYPYGNHLIVKQRGYYKLKMSSHILSIVVIVMIFSALSILTFFLPFDQKTWTTYNLAMILLGITTSRNPRKPGEKIFYICLAFVSLTLSVQLWNDLLKIVLTQRSFREMKTLTSVVEAGVVPALTSEFMHFYFPEDEVLKKLVNKSVTMEAIEDTFACVRNLLSKTERINACDVNHVLGKLVANSYSNREKRWIVTFVDEPLMPSWTAMLLANSSPYMERFNVILRRIFESGLVKYWHDHHRALQYFRSAYGNFFKRELEKLDNSEKFELSNHKKSKLSRHTMFLLIFGHFVGCIVLIVEIAWWCFRNVVMAP